MEENKMEKVAALLGIKLEEEFIFGDEYKPQALQSLLVR